VTLSASSTGAVMITILPLINEALLVADCVRFYKTLLQLIDIPKHVPACRFESLSPGADALVWFSCSQGWKWIWHITVMSCYSYSCRQTSVKLLATFAFQRTTRAQEHWAAVMQDSGLHTRRVVSHRLQDMDNHSAMHLMWLLTDGHITFLHLTR